MSHNHGFTYAHEDWAAPTMVFSSMERARPGYDSDVQSSSEYEDVESVLLEKLKALAMMLQERSKYCIVYAGAGLSTSAGIADYASSSHSTIAAPSLSPMDASPSISHYVLAAMYNKGLIKAMVNQNHDSLPQKAGFRQSGLNDIHGSLFDPSNPVIKMTGTLRTDLVDNLNTLSSRCDMVLVLGTSLSGMNADRIVSECNARTKTGGGGCVGTVMINLQRTKHDENCALRIFSRIDVAMQKLAELLHLPWLSTSLYTMSNSETTQDADALAIQLEIPRSLILEPHVYRVRFDAEGKFFPAVEGGTVLDLREGSFVMITSGEFAGDCGVCTTPNRRGHYRIRFMHTLSQSKEGRKGPMERALGLWWIKIACDGGSEYEGGGYKRGIGDRYKRGLGNRYKRGIGIGDRNRRGKRRGGSCSGRGKQSNARPFPHCERD